MTDATDDLRTALAAFPQTNWSLDKEQDDDGERPVNSWRVTGDILIPTPLTERAAGADPVREIGSLYPPEAAQLAAAAVKAAPELLAIADRCAEARELARRWQENRAEFPESAGDALDRLAALLLSEIRPSSA